MINVSDRLPLALRALAIGVSILGPVTSSVAAQTIREVSSAAVGGVFQLVGEYADGTGFLVDRDAGLVLTNAHVTAGADSVGVRVDLAHKVAGYVVFEDPSSDIAVVKISPDVAAQRPEIVLDPAAYDSSSVGDQIAVIGYPLRKGAVTTAGIVSRKGDRVLLLDANVNRGNSGGPVLDMEGRAIGVTTFLAARGAGTGVGGAIHAHAVMDAVGSWDRFHDTPAPTATRLQTLPIDDYPLADLEEAAAADEWPTDRYDISEAGLAGGRYSVKLITPPLYIRQSGELVDLSYWQQEIMGFPPVVVIRIHPEIGQSGLGLIANLILGAAAWNEGAVQSFTPLYLPEAKGRLLDAWIQDGEGRPIEPIQVKRAAGEIDGQAIQVMHLVYPAEVFQRPADGDWEHDVLNIQDVEDGILPWIIPTETMEQVYRDLESYLSR